MIVEGLMIAGVGKFIHDMKEADKNNERADRISSKAMNQKYESRRIDEETTKQFTDSKKKLVNRKRAILKISFPRFQEIYTKIMEIKFNNDSRGIIELFSMDNLTDFEQEIRPICNVNILQMTDQQLIASFIVPGIVESVLFKGGLLGAIAFGAAASIKKDSEINISMSQAQKKQIRLYAEAVEAKKDAIEAVCWHMDEIADVLAKLNALFLKSIKISTEIIERNGYDSNSYSDKELEYIGTCMNLAKAVKTIIDVPILDENNQLIEAAKEVIVTGKCCIEEFNKLI